MKLEVKRATMSERTDMKVTMKDGTQQPYVKVIDRRVVLVDDLLQWIATHPDASMTDLRFEIAPKPEG